MKKLLMIVLLMFGSILAENETYAGELLYANDGHGEALEGRIDDLKDHILQGGRVTVILTVGSNRQIFNPDRAFAYGDHIYVEVPIRAANHRFLANKKTKFDYQKHAAVAIIGTDGREAYETEKGSKGSNPFSMEWRIAE